MTRREAHLLRACLSARTLTCADLAALGLEGFAAHDGRRQLASDPVHCFCWEDGPADSLVRVAGLTWGKAEYDEQSCVDREARWTAADGTSYDLCCRCLDEAGGREAVELLAGQERELATLAPLPILFAEVDLGTAADIAVDIEAHACPECARLRVQLAALRAERDTWMQGLKTAESKLRRLGRLLGAGRGPEEALATLDREARP